MLKKTPLFMSITLNPLVPVSLPVSTEGAHAGSREEAENDIVEGSKSKQTNEGVFSGGKSVSTDATCAKATFEAENGEKSNVTNAKKESNAIDNPENQVQTTSFNNAKDTAEIQHENAKDLNAAADTKGGESTIVDSTDGKASTAKTVDKSDDPPIVMGAKVSPENFEKDEKSNAKDTKREGIATDNIDNQAHLAINDTKKKVETPIENAKDSIEVLECSVLSNTDNKDSKKKASSTSNVVSLDAKGEESGVKSTEGTGSKSGENKTTVSSKKKRKSKRGASAENKPRMSPPDCFNLLVFLSSLSDFIVPYTWACQRHGLIKLNG